MEKIEEKKCSRNNSRVQKKNFHVKKSIEKFSQKQDKVDGESNRKSTR